MEFARTHDGLFSASHAETTLPLLPEADPVLLQSQQRAELESILQELDELIEAEGGVLIP